MTGRTWRDILLLAPQSEDGGLSCGTSSDHTQEFVHGKSQLPPRHLYPMAFSRIPVLWSRGTHLWPRKPILTRASSKAAWTAGQGRWSLVLLSSPETLPGALQAPLWSSGIRSWISQSRPREGHRNDQRAGSPLPWRKAERVAVAWPKEKQVLRKPYSSFSIQKDLFSGL